MARSGQVEARRDLPSRFILALMDAGQSERKPAIESSAEAKPSLLRRFLLPSWQQRKRMLRREAWMLVIGSYIALAFAYLWPQDFRNTSQTYVAVSLTAFMVRVFVFHLGLLLAIVAASRCVPGSGGCWRRRYR